jgi:hypothetical protein
MQGSPLIARAGHRLILLLSQQRRHRTRQAETEQKNGGPYTSELVPAHAHEDFLGETTISSHYQPEPGGKVVRRGYQR